MVENTLIDLDFQEDSAGIDLEEVTPDSFSPLSPEVSESRQAQFQMVLPEEDPEDIRRLVSARDESPLRRKLLLKKANEDFANRKALVEQVIQQSPGGEITEEGSQLLQALSGPAPQGTGLENALEDALGKELTNKLFTLNPDGSFNEALAENLDAALQTADLTQGSITKSLGFRNIREDIQSRIEAQGFLGAAGDFLGTAVPLLTAVRSFRDASYARRQPRRPEVVLDGVTPGAGYRYSTPGN
jgi:hypothetical protein